MSDGLMLETAFSPFTHSPSIRLANKAMPSSLSADHKWVGDGRPHVDPHRFGFEIFVERDLTAFTPDAASLHAAKGCHEEIGRASGRARVCQYGRNTGGAG